MDVRTAARIAGKTENQIYAMIYSKKLVAKKIKINSGISYVRLDIDPDSLAKITELKSIKKPENKELFQEPVQERIRLLTMKELTEATTYSKTSIQTFCKQGMPHYRLGRNYRFCYADVEKWLQDRIKQENIQGQIYSDDPRLLPMNY